MKQKMLRQRMYARGFMWDGLSVRAVRTELDRLARQVKKIREYEANPAYRLALAEVLNLIREAKQ